jgi:endonuclease/exonuclease/phosphatase (EEP) superfamily protein YafD
MPVIVGGDFNTLLTESLRAHLFLFKKDQFTWATRGAGPTEILGPVGLKLDHIFIKGMRVVAAGTLIDSRASDHRPVWVKLVM